MKETALYLKWIAILCVVMAFFGIGVLAIGYKAVSFNLVATIVLLFTASIVLGVISKKKMNGGKQN